MLPVEITVGFESGPLYQPMTGVANYTFNMVRASLEADSALRFIGFGDLASQRIDLAALNEIFTHKNQADQKSVRDRGFSSSRLAVHAVHKLKKINVARVMYREVRRRNFLWNTSRQKLDLFHAYNFRPPADPGVPILPVIYDLSTFRHPNFHPLERVKWLGGLVDTLASSPLVQTISEFSKREIVDVFAYPSEKILVAPPAAAPLFVPLGEDITQRDLDVYALHYADYILAVGTLEPRKNLRTLVAAYAQLTVAQRALCPLVVVGNAGWGELKLPPLAETMVANGSLRFLSGISDRSLRSLYEGARLLAMPSIYEGFGMPVVEALACGTPVAHSAGTAMDEISGDFGERISALDEDGWAAALQSAMEGHGHADPGLRIQRTDRARQFDWAKSAEIVAGAYRNIAN